MEGLRIRGRLHDEASYLVGRVILFHALATHLGQSVDRVWLAALQECPELMARAAVERYAYDSSSSAYPFSRVGVWPNEGEFVWQHKLTEDYWVFQASTGSYHLAAEFLAMVPILFASLDHCETIDGETDYALGQSVGTLYALEEGKLVRKRDGRHRPGSWWEPDPSTGEPIYETDEAYIERSWKSPWMLGLAVGPRSTLSRFDREPLV